MMITSQNPSCHMSHITKQKILKKLQYIPRDLDLSAISATSKSLPSSINQQNSQPQKQLNKVNPSLPPRLAHQQAWQPSRAQEKKDANFMLISPSMN